MASTAVFTVRVAVSITTGRVGWWPRIVSSSWMPSMPGITMSTSTRSNGLDASGLRASGAELPATGSWLSLSSMRSDSRTPGSSSTMSTRLVGFSDSSTSSSLCGSAGRGGAQPHLERGTPVGPRVHGERAAVALQHGARQREHERQQRAVVPVDGVLREHEAAQARGGAVAILEVDAEEPARRGVDAHDVLRGRFAGDAGEHVAHGVGELLAVHEAAGAVGGNVVEGDPALRERGPRVGKQAV